MRHGIIGRYRAQGQGASMTMNRSTVDCVVVTWDGKDKPLGLIHFDAEPQFKLVLFDFSGTAAKPEIHGYTGPFDYISRKTECKGQVIQLTAEYLTETALDYHYLGQIDDDVHLRVSGINYALYLGHTYRLDAFSPALSIDSHFSHAPMIAVDRSILRRVTWVEIMMPFYRKELFEIIAPACADSVSAWGVDNYLVPTLQMLHDMTRTAMVDAVVARHSRSLSSGLRTYSNGLTAPQEAVAMKSRSMKMIADARPDLIGTAWYKEVFEGGKNPFAASYRRIRDGLVRRRTRRRWI
jgi:hypothetical protein